MRYKIITEDLINNLIEFLDEIQQDAATSQSIDDMHKINFCNWAISELLNSYDAILKDKDKDGYKSKSKKPKPKSRNDYIDETFMDWNLPEMTEDEFEKLVDKFDDFLRGWEKDYLKKNPKSKIKKQPTFRPHIDDVTQHMSLEEIEEFLKDDPELSNWERFELYYEEHNRVQKEKERRKQERGSKPMEQVMKELNIKPSDWKPDEKGKKDGKNPKKPKKK
jgi:hypothetical protein